MVFEFKELDAVAELRVACDDASPHAHGAIAEPERGDENLRIGIAPGPPFMVLAVMHASVACRAQRDQVLLRVCTRMAAEFSVVHLEV
jgi:hypothetical protein